MRGLTRKPVDSALKQLNGIFCIGDARTELAYFGSGEQDSAFVAQIVGQIAAAVDEALVVCRGGGIDAGHDAMCQKIPTVWSEIGFYVPAEMAKDKREGVGEICSSFDPGHGEKGIPALAQLPERVARDGYSHVGLSDDPGRLEETEGRNGDGKRKRASGEARSLAGKGF